MHPNLFAINNLNIKSDKRDLIYALLCKALVPRADLMLVKIRNQSYGLVKINGSVYHSIDTPLGSQEYSKLKYVAANFHLIQAPAKPAEVLLVNRMLDFFDADLTVKLYRSIVDNRKAA